MFWACVDLQYFLFLFLTKLCCLICVAGEELCCFEDVCRFGFCICCCSLIELVFCLIDLEGSVVLIR